jgi:hypothetical protein
LAKGLEARLAVEIGASSLRQKQKKQRNQEQSKKIDMSEYNVPSGFVGMYDKKGKLFFIPPDKVNEALEKKYTYE